MLPLDYADKGVARQRRNVNRLTTVTTLVIISIGAYRITEGISNEGWTSETLIEVTLIFLTAFVISDLASEDDKNLTRVASISSITWPVMVALAVTSGPGFNQIASAGIFLMIGVFLHEHSRRAYSDSSLGRRYRGILGAFGLSSSMALMITRTSNHELVAVSTTIMIIILGYDLLRQNPMIRGRKELMREVDAFEMEILEINERGIRLDHASSLLNLAREEGWNNTHLGSKRLESVRMEIDSALAMDEDVLELRKAVEPLVERAVGIAPAVHEPSRLLKDGDNERSLGSFRRAESHYRSAQISATRICDYWESASAAISKAESDANAHESTQSETIQRLIQIAKEAMDSHRPDEALRVLNTLPEQMQSIEDAMTRVKRKRQDVARELDSDHEDIAPELAEKLESIDDMIIRGELSVAMGALDSIERNLSLRRESKRSFNQSMRQRSTIEKRIPEYHKERLSEKVEQALAYSKSGSWIQADSILKEVLKELDKLQSMKQDTEELILFLEEEWRNTRKVLDANNSVGLDNPTRIMVEKKMLDARSNFERGAYQQSRSEMGEADEGIESLRRLV